MERWGKDHWSTLLYIETRCVDYKGVPDLNHMRTDQKLHPGLVGDTLAASVLGHKEYPTVLAGGEKLYNHDDWSCVDDMEEAGFLKWEGTGIHPLFVLTDLGWSVAHQIRRFLAESEDRKYAAFKPELG